jgi:hypothetical protein
VGHLDELYAKYKDRGLVVLAVTDEPRGLVDKFISDTKAKHPIVIEDGDSLRAFGGTGFPTMALIDARGRIAVAGMPQESDIERLLADTWSLPTLPRKLGAVQKTLEKGDYAGTQKALEAQLAGTGLDEADRKAAEDAVKWIQDRGAKMLAGAEEDEKAGDAYSAAQGFRRTADAFKGAELGTKADAALKALLADKAKKREVDAGDLLEKNRAKVRTMKPEQAVAWCRSFVKNFEGTKAAEKVNALAAQFEQAGKKK